MCRIPMCRPAPTLTDEWCPWKTMASSHREIRRRNSFRIVEALTRDLSGVSSSIMARAVFSGRRSPFSANISPHQEYALDAAMVSALSAVLGSVVGGGASISTAWFTQRAQSRRESVNSEIKRGESVYTEYIAECSKLAIGAVGNTLKSPSTLIEAYALQNRIRLTSSDAVVSAAEETSKTIVAQYSLPISQ